VPERGWGDPRPSRRIGRRPGYMNSACSVRVWKSGRACPDYRRGGCMDVRRQNTTTPPCVPPITPDSTPGGVCGVGTNRIGAFLRGTSQQKNRPVPHSLETAGRPAGGGVQERRRQRGRPTHRQGRPLLVVIVIVVIILFLLVFLFFLLFVVIVVVPVDEGTGTGRVLRLEAGHGRETTIFAVL